jgi:repressor LexA
MAESARVTKKQQELLSFVDGFIKGNGYGPSYREVMRGLGYKSVSTVAIHVDALIAKGYLKKGDDYSKRSLELVSRDAPQAESAVRRTLRHHEEMLRSAGDIEKADVLKRALEILDQTEEKPV